MKLEETKGNVSMVASEEEAHIDLSDWQAALSTLHDIDPADVHTFMLLVRVRRGTIDGNPESNYITMRAGSLQELANMAEMAAQETSKELIHHKLAVIVEEIANDMDARRNK